MRRPVTVGPVTTGGDRLVTEVTRSRTSRPTNLVNVLRPLITPKQQHRRGSYRDALVILPIADNLKRIERSLLVDVPPAGEPIVVPLRNASASILVADPNRLLADSGGVPGAASRSAAACSRRRRPALQQRARAPPTTFAARPGARLIEQLDAPGRAGGNIFIIYLKKRSAPGAQTLRALLSGGR